MGKKIAGVVAALVIVAGGVGLYFGLKGHGHHKVHVATCWKHPGVFASNPKGYKYTHSGIRHGLGPIGSDICDVGK